MLSKCCQKGSWREKEQIIAESPQVIKTPLRPKTIAWCHRSKAAAAEHALSTAAFINIQLSSTKFSPLSTNSRPSTAGPSMTKHCSSYRSMVAIVGSIDSSNIQEIITSTSLNNPLINKPTNSAIDLIAPSDEGDRVIEEEDFEEVDELEGEELDLTALVASYIGNSELDSAIRQ